MTTPEEEQLPPSVRLYAVCHTQGCPAQDMEIPGTFYPYGDFDPPRYMGICGLCQQQITDLRPIPEETEPAEGAQQTEDITVLIEPVEPVEA